MELSEAELLAIVDELKLKPADINLQTEDVALLELRQVAEPFEQAVKDLESRKAISSALETSRRRVTDLPGEIFSHYPLYKNKDLHKCNYAERRRAITLDAGLLSQKLIEKLQSCENFELKTNSEVDVITSSKSTGIVSSVSVVGKAF